GTRNTIISNRVIYRDRTTATGNQWDRTNFVLAREKSGLFSVPVNSLIAPNIYTTTPPADGSGLSTGQYPPLGYAARPIATSEGERCPSAEEVDIPDGYHWAKLWAWRVGVQSRVYVKTSTEVQRTGAIVCDPGNWPGGTNTTT